jgi:hypothetical protein
MVLVTGQLITQLVHIVHEVVLHNMKEYLTDEADSRDLNHI